jgi:hypothetical protein
MAGNRGIVHANIRQWLGGRVMSRLPGLRAGINNQMAAQYCRLDEWLFIVRLQARMGDLIWLVQDGCREQVHR